MENCPAENRPLTIIRRKFLLGPFDGDKLSQERKVLERIVPQRIVLETLKKTFSLLKIVQERIVPWKNHPRNFFLEAKNCPQPKWLRKELSLKELFREESSWKEIGQFIPGDSRDSLSPPPSNCYKIESNSF